MIKAKKAKSYGPREYWVWSGGYGWKVQIHSYYSGRAQSYMEPAEEPEVDFVVIEGPAMEEGEGVHPDYLIDSLAGLHDLLLEKEAERANELAQIRKSKMRRQFNEKDRS